MSELEEVLRQIGCLQRDVGRLTGAAEQMLDNSNARDERLKTLEEGVDNSTRKTGERLGRIEEQIEKMSGPVADFSRLRQRAGIVVGLTMFALTPIMFLYGSDIAVAARAALGRLAAAISRLGVP